MIRRSVGLGYATWLAYRLAHPLVMRVRTHPWLVRALFGVDLPSGVRPHWDTTTLLLRHVLRREAAGRHTCLEVGIGQAALLCLGLARDSEVQVDGIDVADDRVESSLGVATHNGLRARFWRSDLFGDVEDWYDLVFFNPPYVPTEEGRRLRLSERLGTHDQVWDGGPEGTNVLQRFLSEVPRHVNPGGRVVFGVQGFHVPDARVCALLAGKPLVLLERVTLPLNPSVVYVLTVDEGFPK